jgi:hypothetical protein
MRSLLLHKKLSPSDLRQAVYQAYDVMLNSAKEAGRGRGGTRFMAYDEKLVSAYQAACQAYLQAKARVSG